MQSSLPLQSLRQSGRLALLVLVAVGFTLVGCKSSPDRTRGQKWSDRQVRKGVEKALNNDPTFKYTDVKPLVYNGTVQLTGFVETPEQRFRAAELAAHTKGSRQVINQIMLKINPPGAVAIRDPLGEDIGRLMVDTNAVVPQMRNLPASQAIPASARPAPSQPNAEPESPK